MCLVDCGMYSRVYKILCRLQVYGTGNDLCGGEALFSYYFDYTFQFEWGKCKIR